MKKIILILLVIQQFATAQENSVFPNVPYTELSTMALEGDYIYTAGDCNTGLVSKDGGQSWTTITLDDRVSNVRIAPGSNGQKAIYQTRDDIYEFDINTLEFEEISNSSLFLSSGNFISIEVDKENVYVISNQNIHKGLAGEYDWTKVADFPFVNDAVVKTDITENYAHIGSLNGVLLRVNLETEAVEEMQDFQNRISSFDMVTDDLGYFSIQSFPHPVKTTDGGQSYQDLDELPENIGVKGFGDNVIVTVNTNRIYVSTDGGQSSTYIPIPDDGTYDLIYASMFTDDGTLYFAGRSSMVGKTEDFGASFINLNEYKRENLSAIDMHMSGTGVAVGGYSSIIKTIDGGETWSIQELAGSSTDNYLSAVAVISKDKYLVAGSEEVMIIENDQVTSTVPVSLDVMHYNSDGDYLIGLRSNFSDKSIVVSRDQGETWESKAFLPSHNYNISQSPSGKLFIPGTEDNIYTSTDGGETWDIESFGNETSIRRLTWLNDDLGIASTGLQLYRTTDGGATSSLVNSGYDIRNIYYLSEDHIVYTTSNEAQTNIYESTNGGSNFTEVKEFCSQSSSSVMDGTNTIWYAQNGGHINKFKVAGSTATVDLETNSLSVFPNPVSSGQSIQLDLEEKVSEVQFISFSGEVVRKIAPTQNLISTEALNAGMYLVSIKTSDGTKKHAKLVIVE